MIKEATRMEITNKWKEIVSEEEAKGCIINAEPFKKATNSYAVRNLLMHLHRSGSVRVTDPPVNRKMRFAFYKASILFIGNSYIILSKA